MRHCVKYITNCISFVDESIQIHFENLFTMPCSDTSHVVKMLYINTSIKAQATDHLSGAQLLVTSFFLCQDVKIKVLWSMNTTKEG